MATVWRHPVFVEGQLLRRLLRCHHVALEFSRGAALPDPHSVLEDTGKRRRHFKGLRPADIDAKHVARYIKMARQAVDG
ncbi:DUF1801 domain-containing protein [Ensifer adhaerens]|uniref:DUF1801 domain-containing protein n=1 Tax=Ensifer adhaerens TaxID=106592 RepID=UPI001CBE53B3|nr:DUF1801 domain-containing protein [Ensifer adhaerens]MBZ7925418.1 DUF1801 domain-containing protein [Ensifer adhaerens]